MAFPGGSHHHRELTWSDEDQDFVLTENGKTSNPRVVVRDGYIEIGCTKVSISAFERVVRKVKRDIFA